MASCCLVNVPPPPPLNSRVEIEGKLKRILFRRNFFFQWMNTNGSIYYLRRIWITIDDSISRNSFFMEDKNEEGGKLNGFTLWFTPDQGFARHIWRVYNPHQRHSRDACARLKGLVST